MRLALLLLLVVIPASALAAERTHPPASAANLLRRHPGPWRFPDARALRAMRFDPETGEVAPVPADLPARAATTAALRQRAAATVRLRADGSRQAVLGPAFRSYSVVRIGDDGKLVHECLDELEAAVKKIEADREVPR
jgi:hypothetical protein